MASIAIDFDGTVVTHEYPDIGMDLGATSALRVLKENGHQIFLNSMRSGKELEDVKMWFMERGLELDGYNENPSQREWTDSPKVYSNLYIDDAGIGTPMTVVSDEKGNLKRVVDWAVVTAILYQYGLMNMEQRDTLIEELRGKVEREGEKEKEA